MNRKITRALLLLGILGLLLVYFFTVNDLPQRIYTQAQQEYLYSNYRLSLTQNAPIMNYSLSMGEAEGLGQPALMPNSESQVRAVLLARYEEQEGVSVTVYDLEFEGQYRLTGSASGQAWVEIHFPFPGNLETLHDVEFLVDGEEPADAVYNTQGISWQTTLDKGDERQITVRYKASGANSFSYGIPQEQRTPIDIEIVVSGLTGGSVPKTSLPSTGHTSESASEVFAWKYTGLIADRNIQLDLPAQLSFAQRIALLQDDFQALAWMAPFLVGLFVACLAGFLSLAGIAPRLDECLLSGLGLALFYPLLTFASGLLGVGLASIASLVVVAGLQFIFLGLAYGWKRTWKPLGILLLVFLGFFSIGMLLAWRGLLLSSGGLLLVGAFMWYYARRPDLRVAAAAPRTEEAPAEPKDATLVVQQPTIPEIHPAEEHAYCLHCGQALDEAHAFCPHCGHSTETIRLCAHCGQRQFVPPGVETVHCVHCGELL